MLQLPNDEHQSIELSADLLYINSTQDRKHISMEGVGEREHCVPERIIFLCSGSKRLSIFLSGPISNGSGRTPLPCSDIVIILIMVQILPVFLENPTQVTKQLLHGSFIKWASQEWNADDFPQCLTYIDQATNITPVDGQCKYLSSSQKSLLTFNFRSSFCKTRGW